MISQWILSVLKAKKVCLKAFFNRTRSKDDIKLAGVIKDALCIEKSLKKYRIVA